MEKKNFMNRTSKVGTYTVVMTAVVLAVLILANVFVLSAPSKYTKLDMTSLELYTLSKMTESTIPELKEDINIYFLCQGGTDNSGNAMENIPHLTTFLSKYEDLSSHISVEIIDPVANPTFYSKYSETELENYTLIVESAKRHKIIDFYDLYFYAVEGYGNISYAEYAQIENYYNMVYGQTLGGVLNFDGESVITNALDYVTTDKIPAVYYLSDHGTAPSSSLISQVENQNMLLSALSLRTSDIPADAEAIYLNAPTADINEDEAQMLIDYLANGGTLIVNTLCNRIDLPNLMRVLALYGLIAQEGIIIETASDMYYRGETYGLLPTLSADSPITSSMISTSVYTPLAHPIVTDSDLPESITITPLLTTSAKAYTVGIDATTTEKTEASIEGQFTVSALAEKENGGKIIWSATNLFSDTDNSYVSGGNYKYFLSILTNVCEREQVVKTIPSTALTNSRLVVEESQATLWGTLLTVILPLAVLLWGVLRWYLRRRR